MDGVAEKKRVQVTFDKSMAKFVLDSFGYYVADPKETIWVKAETEYEQGVEGCCYCHWPLSVDNLGGVIKYEGRASLVCNDPKCLAKIDENDPIMRMMNEGANGAVGGAVQ